MRSLFLVSSLALVLLTTSCATLFAPHTNQLSVASEPEGAEVYVNGMRMGVTPVVLDLKADQSYVIEYRKSGFESVSRTVNTKVGAGWVILDILGGLIPVIVDASTGAWKQLDQKAINATLVKQQ
jgi:hypothetical protein